MNQLPVHLKSPVARSTSDWNATPRSHAHQPPDRETVLPARMLNEFVYCPRLFYLEFVEQVFVHNADTLAGAEAHKRVDARETGLPRAPETAKKTNKEKEPESIEARDKATPETIHARSVSLYSERLRVTAKLDLVEIHHPDGDLFSGFSVEPVEYKKGRPREGEDGIELWDADKMQLGLQILLLQENGYTCEGGILYYRETRQRVPFTLDAVTRAWIEVKIEEARCALTTSRPEPLDDSPKCPRCSLVGVCLPDETRALLPIAPRCRAPDFQILLPGFTPPESETRLPLDRLNWGAFADLPEVRLIPPKPTADVRRLIAPNPETRALYLHTPGHFLAKKGDTLVVKDKGKAVADFRLLDLHHIALFGPIQVSTAVIHALCERDIPLTYFSMGGWFYGITRGHGAINVFARIAQFATAADPEQALPYARLFVHGKIRNQRTLLMRNAIEPEKALIIGLKHLARAALHARSVAQLLGIEGAAAHGYFGAFDSMLKPKTEHSAVEHDISNEAWALNFRVRNRRPARDPVNALLNLTYSLLSKECTLACHAVGFDPYVGLYHQPRYGRPALALDLMEEFRPLVADSTVLGLVNNGRLGPTDFIHAGDGVVLTASARKTLFSAFEKRLQDLVTHPVFGYKVSYRRAIELQARLLSRTLEGETEQYLPFTTR